MSGVSTVQVCAHTLTDEGLVVGLFKKKVAKHDREDDPGHMIPKPGKDWVKRYDSEVGWHWSLHRTDEKHGRRK